MVTERIVGQSDITILPSNPVTRLGSVFDSVQPPLTEEEKQKILMDFDKLREFVVRKGKLPSGFEPIQGAFADPLNPTHISRLRRRGWVSRHRLLLAVHFEPGNQADTLQLTRILRARRFTSEQRRGESYAGHRRKVARDKHEIPRFRLY